MASAIVRGLRQRYASIETMQWSNEYSTLCIRNHLKRCGVKTPKCFDSTLDRNNSTNGYSQIELCVLECVCDVVDSFLLLLLTSHSVAFAFNGELRPRNAFAIFFFAFTRIPCAAVIFRMELFPLLRFIRLYIFPMHDLTSVSMLIRNTERVGSVSRLQRAKEIYVTGNGGHWARTH